MVPAFVPKLITVCLEKGLDNLLIRFPLYVLNRWSVVGIAGNKNS
jgi:hypothetical protein